MQRARSAITAFFMMMSSSSVCFENGRNSIRLRPRVLVDLQVVRADFLGFVVCFAHIICKLYRFNEALQVFVVDVTESAGINDANTSIGQVGAELDLWFACLGVLSNLPGVVADLHIVQLLRASAFPFHECLGNSLGVLYAVPIDAELFAFIGLGERYLCRIAAMGDSIDGKLADGMISIEVEGAEMKFKKME